MDWREAPSGVETTISTIKTLGESTLMTANAAITAISSGLSRIGTVNVPPPPIVAPYIPVTPPSSSFSAPSDPTAPPTPSLSAPTIPSAPSITIPTPPIMSTISIPPYSDVIPTWSGTVADFTGSSPSISAISVDAVPYDDLYYTTRDKLNSNITNGGTMLNPIIESSIWDRDRERRAQALQDSKDRIVAEWTKLGWTIPDGLLTGQLIAVEKEYLDKDIDTSREIAIKQAEMEQAGMFKSLELGIGFETVMLTAFEKYASRRVETLKINGDILIAVFTQQIAAYNTRLEKYKTDAAVYKSMVDASLARAEVYKAQISGQLAIAQVDEAKARVYASQLQGVEAQVKIYNSQVDAARGLFEIEKGKLELFKAQIDAYVAQVEAGAKKFVGTIQAYTAQVEATKAQNAVIAQNADTQARVGVAYYQGQVAAMEANAKIAEVGAQIQVQALIAAATTSSNLAGGAMAALHASVSQSFSDSNQAQYSIQLDEEP